MRQAKEVRGVTHTETKALDELDCRPLGLTRSTSAFGLGFFASRPALRDRLERHPWQTDVEPELDVGVVDPEPERFTDPALCFDETPPMAVTARDLRNCRDPRARFVSLENGSVAPNVSHFLSHCHSLPDAMRLVY